MNRVHGFRATLWSLLVVSTAALAVSCVAGPVEPAPATTSAGPTEPPLWPRASEEPLDDDSAEALQQSLDEWAEIADVPGATAAVVTADGAWAGATGIDGVGNALQPDSAAAIASITKTFIAAEVMRLVSRGAVDLDEPVSTYVDLPFDDDGATVRQVLGMQSGFPQDPLADIFRKTTDPDREWTVQDVLDRVISATTQGELGGESNYNNLNYLVLGMLVEQVSDDRLAAVLRRDLIDPAGLDRVWFQTAEQATPPLAFAADENDEPPVDDDGPFLPSEAVASAAGAAGGMAADAASLARWGHLLYGGHVLDASLVAQMTQADDADDWYGLGTVLADIDGAPVILHDGDLGVYHSVLIVWPSGISVAVLVPSAWPATLQEERTIYGLSRTLHATISE